MENEQMNDILFLFILIKITMTNALQLVLDIFRFICRTKFKLHSAKKTHCCKRKKYCI